MFLTSNTAEPICSVVFQMSPCRSASLKVLVWCTRTCCLGCRAPTCSCSSLERSPSPTLLATVTRLVVSHPPACKSDELRRGQKSVKEACSGHLFSPLDPNWTNQVKSIGIKSDILGGFVRVTGLKRKGAVFLLPLRDVRRGCGHWTGSSGPERKALLVTC